MAEMDRMGKYRYNSAIRATQLCQSLPALSRELLCFFVAPVPYVAEWKVTHLDQNLDPLFTLSSPTAEISRRDSSINDIVLQGRALTRGENRSWV